MSENEFDEADAEAAVLTAPKAIPSEGEVLPVKQDKGTTAVGQAKNLIEYRTQLVEQYHKGAPSLVEKIRESGRSDFEALLLALIDEIITETDHLLGNELVATQNGDLRDASIISFKRAEVLEKAWKAVERKTQFEKERGIDVDSPAMTVIFKFFMGKAAEAFDMMGVADEIRDLFFRRIAEVTDNWRRELRERFEELRQSR